MLYQNFTIIVLYHFSGLEWLGAFEHPCLLASLLQVIQANSGHLWVSQRAFRGSPDALPWSCEECEDGEDVSK